MSNTHSHYLIVIIVAEIYDEAQPYIALAVGLHHAGYRVRIVVPHSLATVARSHHLDVWSMPHTHPPDMTEFVRPNGSFRYRHIEAYIRTVIIGWSTIALSASRGAHLIISGLSTVHMAQSISETLNIPLLPAYITPMHHTSTHAHPFMARWWQSWYTTSTLSYSLFNQLSWHVFRYSDTLARTHVFALPQRHRLPSINTPTHAILYGISPTLWNKPRDWGTHLHVTGTWQPVGRTWPIPATLEAFLQAGPSPIFVSFAKSNSVLHHAHIARVIHTILQRGERVVLWQHTEHHHAHASTVFVCQTPVAQEYILSQMKLIVHDGSIVSTVAAAHAGIPQIIIPSSNIQQFWGKQLTELGLTTTPIPLPYITEQQLTTALHHTLTSQYVLQQVRHIQTRMHREDGIAHACSVIDALFTSKRSH